MSIYIYIYTYIYTYTHIYIYTLKKQESLKEELNIKIPEIIQNVKITF